jgi:hypothetical protein
MSPDLVHLLAYEIRSIRSWLTAQEKWTRAQESSAAKIQQFHRINFWRKVLVDAERHIRESDRSTGVP